MIEISVTMQKYFDSIEKGIKLCYHLASRAREKGLDPDTKVEIPLARDMAERVEGLIAVAAPQVRGSGISQRIKELEIELGSQNWKISFLIAEEIANEKFCKFKNKQEAMEVALRAALAYITNGVVSSPLEGFVRLELKKRKDGKEYFCLYFGGPIRSAGTTATCIFLGAADYLRLKMGYDPYDPTEEEIKRTYSELEYFHERVNNLQYFPSEEEAEFITRYLPIQIDGDASEEIDVPNYKDLPRVSTNKLRNGFCLVMAEGLCQKFAKFWGKFSKWNKEMGMGHWEFLENFVKLQKLIRSKGTVKKTDSAKIVPDYNYIKDLVAGRPILGYPLRTGAFRLRLGRARTIGLSDTAISPSTMFVLEDFIAYGTQLKTERPGKATTISSCDRIEGPIVKLRNGDVVFVDDEKKAKEISKDVEEIIFLGDILVNYGYFLNRGHILTPVGYNEDWWALELEKHAGEDKINYKEIIADPGKYKLKLDYVYELSKKYNIPLHPRYTYHWCDINLEDFEKLIDWLKYSVITDEKIILPVIGIENNPKRILELIGVPHKFANNEYVVIEGEWAGAFKLSLGIENNKIDIEKIKKEIQSEEKILNIINKISLVKLRDKSGLFIGSRMGRPEKAKMRKLKGSPHTLFPVGDEGGRMRSLKEAIYKGKVTAQFTNYYCDNCKMELVYPKCYKCETKTRIIYECRNCDSKTGDCGHSPRAYNERSININEYYESAIKKLGIHNLPEVIKGVRGTANKMHLPELLEKGILRAVHNVNVNKDGTIRYDMTEMSITHFKPKEIATSINVLRECGYTKDTYGNELINEEQILELKCQDIILPACPESKDEGADVVFTRVANFLDDLLEKVYGLPRFYNIKKREDLVGHLLIGLSPHTAAGIVGRIIGFSKVQVMLASPLMHSIMRRDSDGDEAGVMLLLDALINFSPKLLSDHRGATQDEPLVLSSMIVPKEVDDMVFDMDIAWRYPLELYEACLEYKPAHEVKIETLKSRLGTERQYEGYGFTHDTEDFNNCVRCSGYKTIPTMQEKVERQMILSEKIRAIDINDVARLVVERHFIRDIKGNLRKFSSQQFRCVGCNEKYRRPPLRGNCVECGGKLIFTISEGSVIKYLEPSLRLAEKYNFPAYLKQTLYLTKQRIEAVFGKEREKQDALNKWFA